MKSCSISLTANCIISTFVALQELRITKVVEDICGRNGVTLCQMNYPDCSEAASDDDLDKTSEEAQD